MKKGGHRACLPFFLPLWRHLLPKTAATGQPNGVRAVWRVIPNASQRGYLMNGIIYLVGLVVIVLAILSFIGLA